MSIDIKVPAMGESVTEATVARWFKKEGESVARDEPLLELETDKVTVEVPAPAAGSIESISVKAGATVQVGTVLGSIAEGKAGKASSVPAAKSEASKPAPKAEAPKPAPAPKSEAPAMPSAQRIGTESGISTASVPGSGRDGRVTKGDMLEALESRAAKPAQAVAAPSGPRAHADREERVPMSRLRKTIALRLKESQNTAAQLTTFNEVDMTRIMALRSTYKDSFEKKHGVRLGFMGFFAKACVAALKELPNVNAEIEGDNIVYKNYYDIGVAVSTERGLVVPVVRDADQLSLAAIEKAVMDFGVRARDGKLKLDELQGGTFSITNGGVFGSLMSTPILNSPQSGILGMHKIQPRPMAIDGKVEIRPMMYLALSYDHRLVDGRDAVTFLVRVKENLEDPERMLLDV
ncbi:MAG TPA: 2-oxoglutarate dehydrogenase complex dihydrolipoyllysine-residue succinyltransferase [Rhizomicrobium sp.]|jgi:2-oxoglutarate dehydrogenase E2 component (dihydrolipoamide succinyltransferase)|nr:2-oxoglutarate dehydrogenase complex dihydrolipoyllysine-residue succinyltransferase [Rhizomicrobium sp.]